VSLKNFLPFLLVGLLLGMLYQAIEMRPKPLARATVQRIVPDFSGETVFEGQAPFTSAMLRDQITLVHVWGAWCHLCRDEQLLWLDMAKEWPYGLYAINYKDSRVVAQRWLETYGNPYQAVLFDPAGQIARLWGITGAPETYLIDFDGRIRYEVQGPLDRRILHDILLPLAEKIAKEQNAKTVSAAQAEEVGAK